MSGLGPLGFPSSRPEMPSLFAPAERAEDAPAEAHAALLRFGSRGAAVQELQGALNALGLPAGAVDGVFGRQTERALLAFQRSRGLTPDGIAGPRTAAALAEALATHGSSVPADPTPDAVSGAASRLGPAATPLDHTYSGAGAIRAVQSSRATQAFQFDAKMAICADGASNVTSSRDAASRNPGLRYDPWYQPRTAMNFAGQPVDADRVPYVVLPPPLARATGATLGDLVEVAHAGRKHYAIYAEVGPAAKLGEGSMFLARKLGIDDDPHGGGISNHAVTYTVLPRSGRSRGIYNGGPAVADGDIQRLGGDAFAEARSRGIIR